MYYFSNLFGFMIGIFFDEMVFKWLEDEYGEKVNRVIVDMGVKMGKVFFKDRMNMYIDKVVV